LGSVELNLISGQSGGSSLDKITLDSEILSPRAQGVDRLNHRHAHRPGLVETVALDQP